MPNSFPSELVAYVIKIHNRGFMVIKITYYNKVCLFVENPEFGKLNAYRFK